MRHKSSYTKEQVDIIEKTIADKITDVIQKTRYRYSIEGWPEKWEDDITNDSAYLYKLGKLTEERKACVNA